MFRAAALLPSPPLLVPELMGRAGAEVTELRTAATTAATFLASAAEHWIAIGVERHTQTFAADTVGTMRGYGVDVVVSLSAMALPGDPDPALPLTVLLAGWLRGVVSSSVDVEVRTIAESSTPQRCAEIGMDLRAELDASPANWGLLVLGDGANTLTPKAPGAFDERSSELQGTADDALAAADITAIAEMDPESSSAVGMAGRAAWQVLAGVVGAADVTAVELYRGAPFGVGYFVGTWCR